jgi:drug/metabolite transporter (DMT)-like permease
MASVSINKTMGLKEWGIILLLSILWGGSFFFNEIALRDMTPLTIVLFRIGIAALILLGFMRLTGQKMPLSAGLWVAFFIMGAINNLIPFSLIVWGQKHIDSSLASILNATTPIFSVIMAHLLTKEERLTPNRITGILIGWIGVIVLIGIESLKGFGIHVFGQIAILGASFCYSCAAIYGRRFKKMSPLVVTTGMLCGSAIMMAPIALIIERPWQLSPGTATWAAIMGLAVLGTAIAYIFYFRVLASSGATNILLVTFLIPIGAILLGVLVLGEAPGWNAFGGMGLIFWD